MPRHKERSASHVRTCVSEMNKWVKLNGHRTSGEIGSLVYTVKPYDEDGSITMAELGDAQDAVDDEMEADYDDVNGGP